MKRVYWHDFEIVEFEEVHDGAAIRCKDPARFARKVLYTWMQAKEAVVKVKINVVDGGGLLKLLLQFIFKCDPLMTHDFPKCKTNPGADGKRHLLDSGVDSVLVLVSAKGVIKGDEYHRDKAVQLGGHNYMRFASSFRYTPRSLPAQKLVRANVLRLIRQLLRKPATPR